MEEVGFDISLQTRVTKLKLSYFGHVLRGEGLEKSIMLRMGNGCRGRGRPRKRWLDEIERLLVSICRSSSQPRGTWNNEGDWSMSSPKVVHDLTV